MSYAQEVTHSARRWVCSDGSVLRLDATLIVAVSDIQVTLIDSHYTGSAKHTLHWQRLALIDWVACHQNLLRRLRPVYGEPEYLAEAI